jgi:hypothetical protein
MVACHKFYQHEYSGIKLSLVCVCVRVWYGVDMVIVIIITSEWKRIEQHEEKRKRKLESLITKETHSIPLTDYD